PLQCPHLSLSVPVCIFCRALGPRLARYIPRICVRCPCDHREPLSLSPRHSSDLLRRWPNSLSTIYPDELHLKKMRTFPTPLSLSLGRAPHSAAVPTHSRLSIPTRRT